MRATPTAQAAIDPLSLRERVGVREPRGKQAAIVPLSLWERQGYWWATPTQAAIDHPLPEGEGLGSTAKNGTGRTGLRPPSPRGRGVGFGTERTGLRPPSPRGRGVGFGTGRTGLRPPSPRGRGVLTRPGKRESRRRGAGIGSRCLQFPVTESTFPNSASSRSRASGGSGGLSAAAMLASRCFSSPVPVSTTSAPGSCTQKR